ncbi:acetolactate synthase [Tanacetum coccineum]
MGEGKGPDFSSWRSELDEQKVKFPLSFKTFGEAIPPQYAIQVLDELMGGDAIISAMGFGLPIAIEAAVARPDVVVVDIGDGSFMMNVQELATIRVEIFRLRYCYSIISIWAWRYNGRIDMLKFAEACDILAARVTKKVDLRAAIQKMLDATGPYLLDVIVLHQEHVLPMIPAGMDIEVGGPSKAVMAGGGIRWFRRWWCGGGSGIRWSVVEKVDVTELQQK